MHVEDAEVLSHETLGGGYRRLRFRSPRIAACVRPGQFIHLRVPRLDSAALRRPFSVFTAREGALSLLYKCVGKGTAAMQALDPGDPVSLLGPLGTGFPAPQPGCLPVLVAGGYGVAPVCFLAEALDFTGHVFIGGAGEEDILVDESFVELGWPVHVATEDGSRGTRGLVTQALDAWLAELDGGVVPEFFACGPHGMLRVVAERAAAGGWTAWVSLDRRMGCGVGACLACVQRVRTSDGSETWARGCREGPVFDARDVVWREGDAEQ